MQPLDYPVVTVVNRMPTIGQQLAVVAAADDLVTNMKPISASLDGSFRLQFSGSDSNILGGAVEREVRIVGAGGHQHLLTALSPSVPGRDDPLLHFVGRAFKNATVFGA